VNIGAEDIHDGKIKLILGLIWTLILRFQIMAEDEESAGARQALLDWCNSVLNPQGLFVKNFTSDWQDGRCFCGLVNAIEPSHIPLNTVPASEAVGNMNKAFVEAEKLFGFPQVLDAVDVVENPDDLSIMTYVSYFRAYMLANNAFGPNCVAEGPGLTEATTFEKAPFKIITYNEEGQRVERGGAMIKCSLTDASGAEVCKIAVIDLKNGSYDCHYIAERPGQFTLDIQVKKQGIKSNPFHPTVKPGEPSPGHCEAFGPGISAATAGVEVGFTVVTKDVAGNKIPRGGANIRAVFKDPKGDVAVRVADNNDGTYACTYTARTAGTHQLSVVVATQFNGTGEIKNAPFSVKVAAGAFDIGQTGVEIPNPGFTGRKGPKVTVKDNLGNPRAGHEDDVEADLTPKLKISKVKAKSNGDGTYDVEYPSNLLPGAYEIDIRVNGQNAPKSPFTGDVKKNPLSGEHQGRAGHPLLAKALLELTEAEREQVLQFIGK